MKVDVNVDYLPPRPNSEIPSPKKRVVPSVKPSRPLSSLSIASSPTKNNSIDNLSDKYVSHYVEKCGKYDVL